MRRRATLTYDVPPEVACDYLSEATNRPQWQSSLRRVVVLDPGEAHVGQRWEDHTAVGLVAHMSTTGLRPGQRWSESGTWRGVSADLSLSFSPWGAGCRVELDFEVRTPGASAPLGWVASIGGLPAVRADLAEAGRILSERSHP